MDPQKTPQNQDKSDNADNIVDPETAMPAPGVPPVEEADNVDNGAEQPESTDVPQPAAPDSDAQGPETGSASQWPPKETEAPAEGGAASDQTPPPAAEQTGSGLPAADTTSPDPTPEAGTPAAPSPSSDAGIVLEPLPVSAPAHHKKGLLFGLILVAILLLLTGGAAASYYYVVNKPENVLKQALANVLDTEKTKTVHFSGTLAGKESGSGSLEATYTGAIDNKTGAFDVSGTADAVVTKVTFDVRSTDAKTFYAKLGGLAGLPELMAASGPSAAAYAPLVSTLDEQWIEINESLLKQFDGAYQSGAPSQADVQKITDAYLRYPFLVVGDVLADQTVGGESCFHYKVLVDAGNLKDFLAALKNAKVSSYKLDDATLKRYDQMVDNAKLSKYPFELWISKGGKMVKQATLKFGSNGSMMDARFTIDSYNQPVHVDKPKDSKSLLEIMSSFLGTGGTNVDTVLQDAEQQSGISL